MHLAALKEHTCPQETLAGLEETRFPFRQLPADSNQRIAAGHRHVSVAKHKRETMTPRLRGELPPPRWQLKTHTSGFYGASSQLTTSFYQACLLIVAPEINAVYS